MRCGTGASALEPLSLAVHRKMHVVFPALLLDRSGENNHRKTAVPAAVLDGCCTCCRLTCCFPLSKKNLSSFDMEIQRELCILRDCRFQIRIRKYFCHIVFVHLISYQKIRGTAHRQTSVLFFYFFKSTASFLYSTNVITPHSAPLIRLNGTTHSKIISHSVSMDGKMDAAIPRIVSIGM